MLANWWAGGGTSGCPPGGIYQVPVTEKKSSNLTHFVSEIVAKKGKTKSSIKRERFSSLLSYLYRITICLLVSPADNR